MFVLEICIGPARSIYSSYTVCCSVGVRVVAGGGESHDCIMGHPWLVRSVT